MKITNISLIMIIFGLITIIKTSLLDGIDLNEMIDDKFKTSITPTSLEEAAHSISKVILDFVLFSLQSIPEPISTLSIQFCFVNTLKSLIFHLENFEDSDLFLDQFNTSLKEYHRTTQIFTISSIDRLTRILGSLMKEIKSDNENFDAVMSSLLLGLKWTVKEISLLETFEFSALLEDLINNPIAEEHLTVEIYHKIRKLKTKTSNIPSISTLQVLSLIQDENIENILLITACDFITDSHVFKLILKLSEFELRKYHDFKIQFLTKQHSIDFGSVYARSIDILGGNLKSISKVKFSNFMKIKLFIEEIIQLPPLNCKEDVDLITYFIQETKHAILRDQCFVTFKETSGFATEFMVILTNFLQNLLNIEEMNRFLGFFYKFLSNESLETILKVSNLFPNLSNSDTIELALCIELGLKIDFPILREYIFNVIFDIEEGFCINPWLGSNDEDEAELFIKTIIERKEEEKDDCDTENGSLRI